MGDARGGGVADPAHREGTLAWLLRELEETEGRAAYDTGVPHSSRLDSGAPDVPRRGRRGVVAVGLGVIALAGIGVVGLGAAVVTGQLSSAAAPADRAEVAARGAAPATAGAAPDGGAGVPGPAADAAEPGPDGAPRPTVDPAWLAETAAAAEIPEPALRAYANAALTLGREQPGCGIGWNTLAAIGQVETHHGTIGAAELLPDGRAVPRIVGVALDGIEFAAIPDTDGGSVDGDTRWDRAVGPMQFIPQTWAEYGRSAAGSGSPNIDLVDDAALSAADMLCTIGGDLRVAENWIAAVNAYNPSVAYNNDVADAADRYAAFG